jgi:hypothetical protein
LAVVCVDYGTQIFNCNIANILLKYSFKQRKLAAGMLTHFLQLKMSTSNLFPILILKSNDGILMQQFFFWFCLCMKLWSPSWLAQVTQPYQGLLILVVWPCWNSTFWKYYLKQETREDYFFFEMSIKFQKKSPELVIKNY